MSTDDYDLDEFDRAGDKHPVGAHRQPEPRWKTLLPFLLVLILVPILAWAAAAIISGGFKPDEKPVAEQTQQHQTTKPEKKPTQQPQTTKPKKDTDKADISQEDKDRADIAILNVNAPTGTAGSVQEYLRQHDYTNIVATNSAGVGITGTSVFYADDQSRDVAEDIGSALDIDDVRVSEQLCAQYESDVVVFLFDGYQPPAD